LPQATWPRAIWPQLIDRVIPSLKEKMPRAPTTKTTEDAIDKISPEASIHGVIPSLKDEMPAAMTTEDAIDKISHAMFHNAKGVVRKISRQCDVQEHLDQYNATDECLDTLANREKKALGPKNTQMTFDASRPTTLTLLEYLVFRFMPGKFPDAVMLLDNYCSHKADAFQDEPPLLCAAVVNLLMKQDDIRFDAVGAGLVELSCQIMDGMLEEQGLTPIYQGTMTGSDLLQQELVMLSSIQWRLSVPIVSEWIRLSATRLHVLTCSQFRPMTTPLWEYASCLMPVLTLENAATLEFSPRRVANGAIIATCLMSSLICIDNLEFLVDTEKAEILTSFTLDLPMCPKVDALHNKHAAIFLAALLAATGSSLEELLEDARVVRDAILASPSIAHWSHQARQMAMSQSPASN
jgi:hypothetical protein